MGHAGAASRDVVTRAGALALALVGGDVVGPLQREGDVVEPVQQAVAAVLGSISKAVSAPPASGPRSASRSTSASPASA